MTVRYPQLDEPDFWDRFFDAVAESTRPGHEIAKDFGVPYKVIWQHIDKDPNRKDLYRAAMRLQAGLHAAKVGEVLERLEHPGVDEDGEPLPPLRPDAARVLLDGHKWLAAKKDRETYGDDRQPLVQVNFDTAGLAELRRLASAPVPRLEDGRVIEGEFTALPTASGDVASPVQRSLDDLLE